MGNSVIVPYAPAIIKLLQGPLFSDETAIWNVFLGNIEQIQAYFMQIGLTVQFYEEDGFVYLRQSIIEDDEGHIQTLPRLTRRDRLNYPTTLLCVLLREQLDLFESNNMDGNPCILSKERLRDILRPFFMERTDELAVQKKIDAAIKQVVDFGFLRRVSHLEAESYEVRRIIKARINAEQLVEIKEKLERYANPTLPESSDE